MEIRKINEKLNSIEVRLDRQKGMPPYRLYTKVKNGYVWGLVDPDNSAGKEIISKADLRKIPGIALVVVYDEKEKSEKILTGEENGN